MIIALDYDNTYSRDTELWDKFITNAQEHGHRVQIVTSRSKDTPVEHEVWFKETYRVYVTYCEYRAKKQVTEELGIKIDIWIDDDPEYIGKGFIND